MVSMVKNSFLPTSQVAQMVLRQVQALQRQRAVRDLLTPLDHLRCTEASSKKFTNVSVNRFSERLMASNSCNLILKRTFSKDLG